MTTSHMARVAVKRMVIAMVIVNFVHLAMVIVTIVMLLRSIYETEATAFVVS